MLDLMNNAGLGLRSGSRGRCSRSGSRGRCSRSGSRSGCSLRSRSGRHGATGLHHLAFHGAAGFHTGAVALETMLAVVVLVLHLASHAHAGFEAVLIAFFIAAAKGDGEGVHHTGAAGAFATGLLAILLAATGFHVFLHGATGLCGRCFGGSSRCSHGSGSLRSGSRGGRSILCKHGNNGECECEQCGFHHDSCFVCVFLV